MQARATHIYTHTHLHTHTQTYRYTKDMHTRKLSHRIGGCTTPPHFCIVLEFVSGGPLTRRLSATLEPALLHNWAAQIAQVCMCVCVCVCECE
jgi:hypothetical protein